jgi:hypothetical protein
LSAGACRVFCELALWVRRGDGSCSRGQRAIASAIGVTQETVRGYIRELVECGHIEMGGTSRRRRWYSLASPVYWEKAPARKRKAA